MKAMKQLNDLKAVTQVAERPTEVVEEKVEENAEEALEFLNIQTHPCLLYTSPSPRDS